MSTFKSFRIAGLCLVAVFAVSLVASATASATEPIWKQCVKNAGTGTKWENNKCNKVGGTNEWEWVEVTTTEKVESSAKLKLSDNIPIIGKVTIECTGTDKGSIGPGKYDRTESIQVEIANCKNVERCEKIEEVTAIDLPWQTQLFETNKEQRDRITENGNGTPGWVVTCRVLGITKEDKCTTNEGTTLMNDTKGIVEAVFDEKSGTANCTVGGNGAGTVRGTNYIWPEGGSYAIQVS